MDSTASRWLTPNIDQDSQNLTLLRSLCLALLEESDYLAHCSDQERVRYQEQLSASVGCADTYLEAIGLIQREEHTAYITTILTKLRNAGYLYNPDKHLRLLMSLFTLDKTLMNTPMKSFFDIIISKLSIVNVVLMEKTYQFCTQRQQRPLCPAIALPTQSDTTPTQRHGTKSQISYLLFQNKKIPAINSS